MVHVLHAIRNTAPKRNYHNKDFAAQMKDRGLYPSNTGTIGGKETGAQMSHYIIPGGAFECSYERLHAKGWRLNLQSAIVAGRNGGRKNKTAFTCRQCGVTAWGKPNLFTVCGACLVEGHPELADLAEPYRMTQPGQSQTPADPIQSKSSDSGLEATE
jgi:hypothetical protein